MASPPVTSQADPGAATAERLRASASAAARATAIGVATSAVLAAVKIVSGLVGASYALVADGVESAADVASGLVVLATLRISIARRTDRFPYGLGKVEHLGALVVAALLIGAAFGIATQALHEIRLPQRAPAPFTLGVLVLVVLVKETLFRRLTATAERVGSDAVRTDAWHHRSDALTSLAAFIGITIALVGGEGYESADDWAALGACGIILWNGGRLFWGALQEMLDAQAPREVEDRVRAVARAVEGVSGIDVCRVRRAGLAWLIDIHVEVDGAITVRRGHEIGHDVKDALLASEVPVADVLVHVEPVRRADGQVEAG